MTAAPLPSSKTAEQRAHEPSMEEILASIRRIIADDQVLPLAARVPAPAAQPPAVQSPVRLTPSSIGRIRPEEAVSLDPAPMATLAPGPVARTVLRDDIAPPLDAGGSSAAEVAAPSRPLSEGSVSAADIARRVAITEIEPSTLRPRVAAEPTALRSDEAYRHALSEVRRRQDPSESKADGSHLASRTPSPPRLTFEQIVEREVSYGSEPPRRIPEPPTVEARFEAAHYQPAPNLPVEPAFAPTSDLLLSANADASISSAFQALSSSLQGQHDQIFEAAARDMLRPMLKQWLDDNLPTMVERMVRAEIERVARGGR